MLLKVRSYNIFVWRNYRGLIPHIAELPYLENIQQPYY